MTTLKAVRIHEYGGANMLRHEVAPPAVAGAREVLVQVAAAGVNPIDWKVRAGYLRQMLPVSMPWTPRVDPLGKR